MSIDKNAQRVSLKAIARHLGLSTTTISVVINDAPAAKTISPETKDRILKAAHELNYRPNFFARSLRQQRTFMVAIVLPEISEGYGASIVGGVEDHLLHAGYLYFVVSHRGKPDLVEEYARLLVERGVEGIVCVNTPLFKPFAVPVVSISGTHTLRGVTNVSVDNHKAIQIAMEHLVGLGHKKIAFFKGHPGSLDTEARWDGVCQSARKLGIKVDPDLTIQLQTAHGGEDPSSPEEGYVFGRKLLDRKKPFTALLSFNDMSAIGAMRAFQDHGLRIPQDVSLVGFDDIQSASFQNPRLTTVRQPLRQMGKIAAATLLKRIAMPEEPMRDVRMQPELIIRESTAPAPNGTQKAHKRSRRL